MAIPHFLAVTAAKHFFELVISHLYCSVGILDDSSITMSFNSIRFADRNCSFIHILICPKHTYTHTSIYTNIANLGCHLFSFRLCLCYRRGIRCTWQEWDWTEGWFLQEWHRKGCYTEHTNDTSWCLNN